MKITFIYDYKDGEIWSTPMALLNEFKDFSFHLSLKYKSKFLLKLMRNLWFVQ